MEQAMNGDVASGRFVEKIISRRCAMLGLSVQRPRELKIIDATPKQITSTDKIEAVLAELKEMDRAQRASSEEHDPPATR
jgi:hypothetical protein